MTGLDADVLTLLAAGNPATRQRAAAAPPNSLYLPVVVAEQALRKRLATVRQAQAGRGRLTIETAYDLFAGTLEAVRDFALLPYTPAAEALYQQWRKTVRIGPRDPRIAAVCVSLSVTLATRNARDFQQVPGLSLDLWP